MDNLSFEFLKESEERGRRVGHYIENTMKNTTKCDMFNTCLTRDTIESKN